MVAERQKSHMPVCHVGRHLPGHGGLNFLRGWGDMDGIFAKVFPNGSRTRSLPPCEFPACVRGTRLTYIRYLYMLEHI